MKLQKALFFFLLITSFQSCLGQVVEQKWEALPFDQFSSLGCDELIARTQNFLYSLGKSAGARGYVVVAGAKDDVRRKVRYELLVKGVAKFMKDDELPVTYIRSERANFMIELWIVKPGIEKPVFKEVAWNFVFPPETKPFILDDDGEWICPAIPFESAYLEYLDANPDARGHVVIYEKSLKKFNMRKKETLILLKEISRRRLRFFHIRRDSAHAGYGATIEYWLVPRKKK